MERPGQVYSFGGFRFDVARRTLTPKQGGTPTLLPNQAFDVLLMLVQQPGELIERSTLMDRVWPNVTVVDNSLSQVVATLRRILGDGASAPRYVATVSRRGYRFLTDVVAEDRIGRIPQAYQLYAVGWSALTRPDGARLAGARQCLEAAVALDPDFAMAWTCLADAYFMSVTHGVSSWSDNLPKMGIAIKRAMALAPNQSEVHAIYGKFHELENVDWSSGVRHYRKALELNPQCYWGQRLLGIYYVFCGRFDDGIELFRRCQAIEPLAVNLNCHIGMAHYYARRYETAVEQLELTLKMDPTFSVAHGFLGRTLLRLGKFDEAIAEFEAMTSSVHSGASDILVAWAMMGRTAEARVGLDRLASQDRPFDVAAVNAALGENDAAMDWLERAAEARAVGFFTVDPLFDQIRHMERFQALVRRLGGES